MQQYLPFTVLKLQYDQLQYEFLRLQQYLPFTVLKLYKVEIIICLIFFLVATVLTVYGIETKLPVVSSLFRFLNVATVLTVYGIETHESPQMLDSILFCVATVLTVYGIETTTKFRFNLSTICNVATVLTVYGIETFTVLMFCFLHKELQQYLPFTVLKPYTWTVNTW